MTALSESFFLTSIHNVLSWLISTLLLFSWIGKPVLDNPHLSLFSFTTDLFEILLPTVICDIYSVLTLTYLLFSCIRKPILDSIIKLLLSSITLLLYKIAMSLYLTRQSPVLWDKPPHIPAVAQHQTHSTGPVGTTPGPEHPQSMHEKRSPHLSLASSMALDNNSQDTPQLEDLEADI